jgi:hypothetical protein
LQRVGCRVGGAEGSQKHVEADESVQNVRASKGTGSISKEKARKKAVPCQSLSRILV